MTAVKEKILIVEDESLLLFAIADELRAAGFEVLEARNAHIAIELLEEHLDIRLIFTDIDMPGSMDGLELSIAVRNRWPPIHIIVTSGKRRPSAERLPSGGRFMAKPYMASAIVRTMKEMLA